MTSVRKTLKTLVWSAQNRSISYEVFPENNHKIDLFLPIDFRLSLPQKLPLVDFSVNLPRQIPRNLNFFFRDLSEALHSIVRSIRLILKISWIEVCINVEVNGFVYAIWHIFYDESKAG